VGRVECWGLGGCWVGSAAGGFVLAGVVGWLRFLSAQLWALGVVRFLFADVFHQAFAFSFLSWG